MSAPAPSLPATEDDIDRRFAAMASRGIYLSTASDIDLAAFERDLVEALEADLAPAGPEDAVRAVADEGAWAEPAALPTLRRRHGLLAGAVLVGLAVWASLVAGALRLPALFGGVR